MVSKFWSKKNFNCLFFNMSKKTRIKQIPWKFEKFWNDRNFFLSFSLPLLLLLKNYNGSSKWSFYLRALKNVRVRVQVRVWENKSEREKCEHMCVCVCNREREREAEKDIMWANVLEILCVLVCVCVCERERETRARVWRSNPARKNIWS